MPSPEAETLNETTSDELAPTSGSRFYLLVFEGESSRMFVIPEGGETVIGHDSVIGGNVWLTRSVPPNSRIYYQSKMYNGETHETDMVVVRPGKSVNQ